MNQSTVQQTQLSFKSQWCVLWAVLTALFFGPLAFVLYTVLCENQSLALQVVCGFLLVVFVLAMAYVPYSRAACIVSEEGIVLSEPIVSDHSFVFRNYLENSLFLIVLLLGMLFMSSCDKPIRWAAIQSARFEEGFWGTRLVLELGGKTQKMSWPLANTEGFQNAVLQYAPSENPLSQLMRSF